MPAYQTLKKIEGFFLSRRTAIVLLLITVAALMISTQLPDISALTTSPYFLILPFFIFISIAVCTLNRLKRRGSGGSGRSTFKEKVSFCPEEEWSIDVATKKLTLMRWNVIESGSSFALFERGKSGFWGSMIFHAGLLMIIIAGSLSWSSLFLAEVLITEGNPIPLGKEGYFKVWRNPLWPVKEMKGHMILESFEAIYEKDIYPVDYVGHVRVGIDGDEKYSTVRVNDPLKIGSLQYTMDKYGFSPGFLIKDTDGKILFDGYVSLILLNNAEDKFKIPGTKNTLHVTFYPDFEKLENGLSTKSRVPKNPVFGLRLTDWKGDEVEKGKLVKLGHSARIGDLIVAPNELRHWVHFGVARDYGSRAIFVSIVLMVTGLIVRFANYERSIKVDVEKGDDLSSTINLLGYSRYFPALFRTELDRIADKISRQ